MNLTQYIQKKFALPQIQSERVKKIKVLDKDYSILLRAGFEREHLSQYEDYLDVFFQSAIAASPGVFVDVGVNVGQALLKVKAIKPECRYVGFEVSVACCAYVFALASINRLNAYELFPIGLSDGAKLVNLQYSEENDPQATLVDNFWTDANRRTHTRTVFVERGDAFLDKCGISNIGVIKVDVEGGELEVMRGLERVLLRDNPILIFEVLPYIDPYNGTETSIMAQRKTRSQEITTFLNSLKYNCFRARVGSTLEGFVSFGSRQFDATLSNYIAIPHDKVSLFQNTLLTLAAARR